MEKRIRTAMIAAAAGLLTAAAAPQTPVIGITEGKGPAHRLTIVSAYSCGYCRILDEQAMPEMRTRWIDRGVQIESVPVSISPTDAATAIAATCGDMRRYARRSTILFRSQGTILGNWNGADDKARGAAVAAQRRGSALRVAEVAGIVSLAASLDLDERQLRACLSEPACPSPPGWTGSAVASVSPTPSGTSSGRPACSSTAGRSAPRGSRSGPP